MQHGRSLVGHVLTHVSADSAISCTVRCKTDQDCVGVNIWWSDGVPEQMTGQEIVSCDLLDDIYYMFANTLGAFVAGSSVIAAANIRD